MVRDFLRGSFLGVIAFGGVSLVDPQDSLATNVVPFGQSLRLGERTSQPIGHHDFCNANITECSRTFNDVPRAHLTGSLWQFILQTDETFNRRITPITDPEQWDGKDEVWSYAPNNAGDCEDYVLEKRRALMARIHPANLLITVVRKPDGEGHAVLTVRTDRGDIFLDNLARPMTVDQSNYRILKIIDPAHEGRWVTVQGRERLQIAEARQTAATQPDPLNLR